MDNYKVGIIGYGRMGRTRHQAIDEVRVLRLSLYPNHP